MIYKNNMTMVDTHYDSPQSKEEEVIRKVKHLQTCANNRRKRKKRK